MGKTRLGNYINEDRYVMVKFRNTLTLAKYHGLDKNGQ